MSTIHGKLKRGGLVAALLVLAMALTAPVASASPASEATEWLGSQLQSTGAGEKYCELGGGPAVGTTIDCMAAFKAAGFTAQEEETYKWILANKNSYVGSKTCSEASSMSAGAVAKLAFAVAAHGGDPMNVEGRNLIADLQCLQKTTNPEKGRFKDKGTGDSSDVIGQSLAIIVLKSCALKKSCASPPSLTTALTNAAAYLRSQQCTENGEERVEDAFRFAMGLEPGTCNDEPPFPSEVEFNENSVDIEATGFAIQALLAQGGGANSIAAFDAGSWMYGERIVTTGPPKRINWDSYFCPPPGEPNVKYASVNATALATLGASEAGYEITPAQEWLADAVAAGSDRGLPACGTTGAGEAGATSVGILALLGISHSALAGL